MIACLDAGSGVSGDMLLGALVDAGLPLEDLQGAVDALGIEGLRLAAARTVRGGVMATKVDVTYPAQHQHRHLSDIVSLIGASALPEDVKDGSIAVFRRLGAAEAAVHKVDVDEVHFHEVGAADALADVVGSVYGIRRLGVEELLVGPVNVGSGHVICAHGVLPVPAPATAALLEGWSTHAAGVKRELTTPTGAAVVTTHGRQVKTMPQLRVAVSGCGAGGSDPPGWPNVLRLTVGEFAASADTEAGRAGQAAS
jgi:pyridinium-3,5-bisthiocarboxylic acid mononucleotide nickel chelatase